MTVDSLEVPAEASESEGLYDGALPGNLVGADDEDLTGFAERTDLEAKDDALVQETLVDGKTKDPCNTHSPPLTFQESRVLDSMVNQAMLSASIEDGLTLPWETGVMTAIFGDEPLVTLPKPVKLTHSLQTDQPLGPRNQDAGTGQASKRLRTAEASQRRFERAIVFKNSLTDRELDDAKWNRALEKLYAIMVSCPAGTPQGVKFDTKDIELNLETDQDFVWGAQSEHRGKKGKQFGPVLHLAQRILYFYKKHPIPFSPDDISDYIWEKHQDGVAYGTLSGFIEAVNFATFVLGLPARDLGKPLVSAFTKGIRDKAATRRPERKQARPLKVSEVMHLEEMLGNDKVDLQDRYAAGAFLFAIYARCRWSDLKRVQDFDLDVALSMASW